MQDYNLSGSNNASCLNGTCPLPDDAIEPYHLKWGLLLLVFVIILTAGGNLLVCVAVCSDRRLQNMTNYFLMSMAIADFLVSIIVMPFGMVVEIYGYFPLEAEFCAFWVTMDVLMCTASIWHMCTMSMDRYFTLKYPMQYGRNKTRTMVAIKIIIVWAVSITISSPICIYGLVDDSAVYVRQEQQCLITLKHFLIYGSIFAFYIPLCIMILTYLMTIKILWKNQNLMRTIERSDFRMRPRHSIGRPCNIRTMVSPPSSDSKLNSHTEVSSLARTPVKEKINLPSMDPSDRRYIEMKEVIDNAYVQNLCSNMTEQDNQIQVTALDNAGENEEYKQDTQNDSSIDISNDNLNETTTDILEDTYNDDDGQDTDCEIEFQQQKKHYLELCAPNLSSVTRVQVQSPSEDEDVDETSSLLSGGINKGSRSIHNSPKLPRFRSRANTDIATACGNYPTSHCSLKIPKTTEKHNLQSSVSCSNFTQKAGCDNELFVGSASHSGGLVNRDYRSVEWCQHFYEIQEEMDQCLKEARKERRLKQINILKTQKDISQKISEYDSTNSCQTQDSGIPPSVQKDELKPNHVNAGDTSESGDSMEEVESSSDNNSDLLTIKLYPKSVYMYKLDIPSKGKSSARGSISKPNGDIGERTRNGSVLGFMRDGRTSSLCSERSLDNIHKVRKVQRNSIKKFIKNCKRKNGFKHLISSKTTTNEKKASKVLGIIFVVFVVLWTPFFSVNILLAICDSCAQYISPKIMSVFVWMGYVASLANPIIYTMFNTAFRRAFTRILLCKICKKEHRRYHRSSVPSYAASVYTDRRQTLSVLLNGNHDRDRAQSDAGSSLGRSPTSN